MAGFGAAAGRETGTAGPSAGAAATAQRTDPDVARAINAPSALGAQPVGALSVERARSQPRPPDAVRRVLQERGQFAASRPVPRVRDISVPTAGRAGPGARSRAGARSGPAPLVLYRHGGGWVATDLDA